jgi:hypothetical protein
VNDAAATSWCTVSTAAGTYNGAVAVSATANTAIVTRAATVTLTAGALTQTVSVTQAAALFYAASAQTWSFGSLTWSDAIHIPDCNKTSYADSYDDPQCRSITKGGTTWYYYNWSYVNRSASTLCPPPWRVPALDDFKDLASHTAPPTLQNEWGYGGYASSSESSCSAVAANYWSCTPYDNYNAYCLWYHKAGNVDPRNATGTNLGLQVRCVK